MWELDHKEEWVLKNWCFWIVVLKKTLESPVDSKEIKPVNSKRNHSWILIGRTDTEAEAPILGPAGVKWKRPRCWERLKARGKVDDREWDGCRASLTQRHEFEQTLGDSEGQGTWCAAVHGVMKSQRRPGQWITTNDYYWFKPKSQNNIKV